MSAFTGTLLADLFFLWVIHATRFTSSGPYRLFKLGEGCQA